MIALYRNGNYQVAIFEDGTKIRSTKEDKFIPERPESMDIKITNYCDMGCPYCHENSTKEGKHSDLRAPSFIDSLKPGTELAIGGGNVLSHPDFVWFLEKCAKMRLIPSITVNQKHFLQNLDLLKRLSEEKLIYGLGVSLAYPTEEFIEAIQQFPRAVVHVINRVNPIADLELLAHKHLKILVLGYKTFRRGIDYAEHTIEDLDIKKIYDEKWFDVLSFDNLALKQLPVKDFVPNWKEFYLGEDGFATMYVDMVERKYAKSSTAALTDRYNLEPTIEQMFEKVRTKEFN